MKEFNTIVLGAGAAGMMCAAHAGAGVLVIDHAKAAGEKIRISGGGRCNFTNLHAGPDNFLSQNPHFAKSALARYTQWDFLDLVGRHGIAWHEKTLGQLFCDRSARDIVAMLLAEMAAAGAEVWLDCPVQGLVRRGEWFTLETARGPVRARNLVIATGGKSIPKMGASGFGYEVAEKFGHRVTETRAGLVPLTFSGAVLEELKALSGVSLEARVSAGGTGFDEALLFTHRGLSGPAVLQVSNYWREGAAVQVDLLPRRPAFAYLRERRAEAGRKSITTILGELLPSRLADALAARRGLSGNIADFSDARLQEIAEGLHHWSLRPAGSEGYRTAEVTLGGVSTEALSARTMQSALVPGLYFIGEVVDVTGWLGGYNFQWAWSSGWAAGTAIAAAQARGSLSRPAVTG